MTHASSTASAGGRQDRAVGRALGDLGGGKSPDGQGGRASPRAPSRRMQPAAASMAEARAQVGRSLLHFVQHERQLVLRCSSQGQVASKGGVRGSDGSRSKASPCVGFGPGCGRLRWVGRGDLDRSAAEPCCSSPTRTIPSSGRPPVRCSQALPPNVERRAMPHPTKLTSPSQKRAFFSPPTTSHPPPPPFKNLAVLSTRPVSPSAQHATAVLRPNPPYLPNLPLSPS